MKGSSMRVVIPTAAVYCLLVVASFLLLRFALGVHPVLTLLLGVLSAVIGVAAVAIGSIRVSRASGQRDILLPLLAVWMGWVTGNLVVHGVVLGARSQELLAATLRPLSLGLLVPATRAASPVALFTLDGTQFGVAVPWVVLIVYTAVFWNRRRQAVRPEA